MAGILALTGLHQPAEWNRSRFRGAVQASISASRMRHLSESNHSFASNVSSESSSRAQDGATGSDAGASAGASDGEVARRERRQEKEAAVVRLESSHIEEKSLITGILSAIDPSMLDSSPRTPNALSGKGLAFVSLCSTMGFHMLRLLIRDLVFDRLLPRDVSGRSVALVKGRLTEVYLLSFVHSLACSSFSLHKILRGRWDSPAGAEPMAAFSLGYTAYSLVALRSQLGSDPMFTLNEVANLIKLSSCLASRGVAWILPALMSAEIPQACLNILRLMAELGAKPSGLPFRMMLGAFTTSFAAIKGVVLPGAMLNLVVRRAKEHPELHQPSFLPAKLAVLVRIALSYTWLSVVAQHWIPTPGNQRRLAAGLARRTQLRHLPLLRDLTSSLQVTWKALRSSFNPFSILYFVVLQSLYFVGPMALPAMVYALAKKPKYRLPSGVGLAALGALALWPIRTDKPFQTETSESTQRLGGALFRVLKSYFSFKAVFEEPLRTDRRYLMAVLPHGVMPFAATCLIEKLHELGFAPSMAGASVLFRIPILRQFARLGGVIPASKRTIMKALQWKHPNNVTFIVPGGIAEIFYMREDVEQVLIKRRKGFVKLALQSGADLVPVYGLGHTHLFTTIDKSSSLGSFLMRMSRRLQISLPLSYGRWGMPLVPHSRPVAAIVGKPIRIEAAVAEPTEEQIDEVHSQFVAELRRIFDKHKHLVPGYENKRLYFDDEEVPAQPRNVVTKDNLFPSTLPSLSSRL